MVQSELSFTNKQIRCGDHEIHYFDEGSGTPILLLHGAPTTALGFARVIQELRKNFRVIAPDLPGFGRSLPAKEFSGGLREYSIFVKQFCEILNLQGVYLYVNDSSGVIGLHAAAQMHERVTGVIIADTVSLPIPGLVRFVLKYIVNSTFVRYLNRRYNILSWMVANLAPLRLPFTSEDRRILTSQFDTASKRDRILDLFLAMAVESDFVDETITEARQHISKMPTLLLFGQFDPMRFIGSIQKFKKMFGNHSVAIIPLEEHFPILASGKQVAQEVSKWIQHCQNETKMTIQSQ